MAAVAPDTEERVRRILTGHELVFVQNLGAARDALNGKIGVIFVGARFDESRMFDLLDYIRKDVEHRKIPIVAAIVAKERMQVATVRGIEYAVKIFGATVFVNLNDFADDETENARIRIIVDALLLPPQVIPKVAEKLSSSTSAGGLNSHPGAA